ncbi:amidohydrolase [Microbacterium sp. No. 7]|uniref:amidohydrolase n=1 Tax=Microbacterium sp. No. 7 TaxID=1714373 RepID=UPI0006D13EA8|nr:amidohydrolase [Microbacterium sp. No. 7]ALJ20251.1 peptidase M20 [Microbacterium sp. No. 7]
MTTSSAPWPPVTEAKARAAAEAESRRAQLTALSHAIHARPELAYEEHEAAALVAEALRGAGFAVEVGAYGLATAVEAVYGDGDLTVAICAEYDALPGIGHGCGHNVIAAAGVGAALALAPVAAEAGLRVKLLGTPAEEHGGGKVDLLLAGAWEDVDFSMMAHGMTGNDRSAGIYRSMAVERLEVVFHGKTAHAAAFPEQGINAGAAATLALTAIALLRQHLPAETSINAFVSHGGEATNIIPDRSVLQVELRARDIDVWRQLKRRVSACFEGAAIATGCTWEWAATEHPYAPVVPDPTLAALWDRNLEARGRELVVPTAKPGMGSTDMGNVTQVVPAIHATIGFLGEVGPAHNPDFTRSAITPAADDAILDAAIAMAWTTLDIALDPERRADFRRRTAERPEGATRATLEA